MEVLRRRAFLTGIALLVGGVTGVVALLVFVPGSPPVSPFSFTPTRERGPGPSQPVNPATPGASERFRIGERIYRDGTDEAGDPVPRSGMGMMVTGCVQCHGDDGRGGTLRMMMGTVEVPDIRWSTLSSPHGTDNKELAFDSGSFGRAVREGVDPEGDRLNPIMPRWDLSDAQVAGVIEYLKALPASD